MKKMISFDLIIEPILTEKSQGFQEMGKYVFKVHSSANKKQIKKSIEEIFKVGVSSVNIIQKPSKNKVFKGKKGVRAGFKKAVVSIVGKQRIELGA
jgi:large subunit ribosomal protein L23